MASYLIGTLVTALLGGAVGAYVSTGGEPQPQPQAIAPAAYVDYAKALGEAEGGDYACTKSRRPGDPMVSLIKLLRADPKFSAETLASVTSTYMTASRMRTVLNCDRARVNRDYERADALWASLNGSSVEG